MTTTPYPSQTAIDISTRRPDIESSAIQTTLMTDPALTADEVIAILDDAESDHAADVAWDDYRLRVGMRVEGGAPGTDDYAVGAITRIIDTDRAEVEWDTAIRTIARMADLRAR